jgi:hypothetical protein
MSSRWDSHTYPAKKSVLSKLFEAVIAAGIVAFAGAAVILMVIVVGGLLSFISGIVFYFCWNHGVVALVSACGGTVAGISYWTAFFSSWFISLIGGLLFRGLSASNKKNKSADADPAVVR